MELPFEVLLAKFTSKLRTFSKSTVIVYANRNPLALLVPDDSMAQAVGAAPHISEQTSATCECVQSRKSPSPVLPSTENDTCKKSPNEGSCMATDWRSEINLSHIEYSQMRARLLDMLTTHAKMWDGPLGTIRPTKHRIDLEEGAQPLRSMFYRQVSARCAIVKAENEK